MAWLSFQYCLNCTIHARFDPGAGILIKYIFFNKLNNFSPADRRPLAGQDLVDLNQLLVCYSQIQEIHGSGRKDGGGVEHRTVDTDPLHGGTVTGHYSYGAAGAAADGAGHGFFHGHLAG